MGDDSVAAFMWLDYVVFIATLLISLTIGIVQGCTGGKQKTTSEYLTGNRKLLLIPVASSMIMSSISAILVLGTTAEIYVYGTQIWIICFSYLIIYTISGHLMVPIFHKLKVTSMFEYHSARFHSRGLVIFTSCLSILNSMMYMGLAMYAPSTALEAVTGFPLWASIICTGFLATIYTTVGGMRAVIWTDFFQGFVMYGGILLVVIMGGIEVGGIAEVWRLNEEGGRIIFFYMDPDPTIRQTFWTAFLGGIVTQFATAASSQSTVQRYCSLPTTKQAKISVGVQGPLLAIIYSLVCVCGMIVYAYYHSIGCDPLRSGKIDNSNQLLPYFIVDVLNYPGFPGLFVAVLFSGALSSISSSLNGICAMTWKDLLENVARNMQESRKALVNKILAAVYGIIATILGFYMGSFSGHVMEISSSILGGISGPLAGICILGTVFPCSQWKGVMISLIVALGFTTWINIGQNYYSPHQEILYTDVDNCTLAPNTTVAPMPENPTGIYWLYTISYHYISIVGFVIVIFFGLLMSFVTGAQKPSEVSPALIIDQGDRWCCCLSKEKQENCWCGVRFDKIEDEDVKIAENHNDMVSIGDTNEEDSVCEVESDIKGSLSFSEEVEPSGSLRARNVHQDIINTDDTSCYL